MKYAFIQTHTETYPVRVMCQALHVSPSGYYGWRGRKESPRAQANRALLVRIKSIHDESRQTYGYPRIHKELHSQGVTCGRHRVARLMRQAGLKTRMTRLWHRARSHRHLECTAENKLQRRFSCDLPNQRWVSDITHVPTGEGWLYVAVLMDLYSRRIVGWSMSTKNDQELVLSALHMAFTQRGNVNGLMVHSDRGANYRNVDYHRLLEERGIEISMSRPGNCLDNAAMESFFHTLKTEHTHHYRYKTRDEARRSIFEYIEVFYNQRRRHSTLGYMTPSEYERYNVPNSVSV